MEFSIQLLITFSIAAFVIFIMRFKSNKSQEFIFGKGIKTPGLNVVRIFFGIGQNQLPQESTLRFIFIFFVLFCLIEFITSNMRKEPPKTLEEVIDRGYTIVFQSMDQSTYQNNLNFIKSISKR